MRKLALLVGLALAAVSARGVTVVVNPAGTGDYPTIQAAIDALDTGDIIELTDGTFTGAGNHDVGFRGKALTVRSQSGDPATCIIDCEGQRTDPHRGFIFTSHETAASILEGVTITHGWAAGTSPANRGGGVYCGSYSSPSILHCVFAADSTTGEGGGLNCSVYSNATVTDCVFLDDYAAASGGGLRTYWSASPTVTRCVFVGCHSDDPFGVDWRGGGAVSCERNSYAHFIDCTFTGNTAVDAGGGVNVYEGSHPTFTRCVFTENQAPYGGALELMESCGTDMIDCELVDNTAEVVGGAIDTYWAALTFLRCEFTGNTAPSGGGGAVNAVGPYHTPPMAGASFEACTFSNNGGGPTGGGALVVTQHVEAECLACTFYGNAGLLGSAIEVTLESTLAMENTIVGFGLEGMGVHTDGSSTVTAACCDVYGNTGGDWVGPLAGQLGINGNICEDPLFCMQQHPTSPFTLYDGSPCLPEYSGCGLIGAWSMGCGPAVVGSEDHRGPGPWIESILPNPFRQSTGIRLQIQADSGSNQVSVGIFDLGGRLVRSLVSGPLAGGSHVLLWDGKDGNGAPVQAGEYFCRLSTGERVVSRRLLLVR